MSISDRTGLEELSEDEAWALIQRKTVGRLAISINNRPDIFPVNYRVVNREILIKTAAGIKLAAATLGQGVAFEVDDLDEKAHTGSSVVLIGTAKEVKRLDDLMAAEDLNLETWAESNKNRYFRVIPERVTGRRVPPH